MLLPDGARGNYGVVSPCACASNVPIEISHAGRGKR